MKDLKEQFEAETGNKATYHYDRTHNGWELPALTYVQWLEDKVLKQSTTPEGCTVLGTIKYDFDKGEEIFTPVATTPEVSDEVDPLDDADDPRWSGKGYYR